MTTTVMVSDATRAELGLLKESYGLPSLDATLERLLAVATPDARALYATHKEAVDLVCQRYGITELVAFGSRVRDDRQPSSDLDLVARFPEDATLFDVVDATAALSAAFGVRVDLGEIPVPGARLGAVIEREGVRLV